MEELAAYHLDREFISASGLKAIAKSPRHYWHRYLNPNYIAEDSPAMAFGNLVHTLILEPATFTQRYAIAPECDRRTKEGKQTYADFEANSIGKEVVSNADYLLAWLMVAEAKSNPIVSDLLEFSIMEKVYTFDVFGTPCKMRADAINDLDSCIIDIKTCKDASPAAFGRDAYNLGYLLQAAFYLDGYYLATGINLKRFIFVAMEKSAPFITAVYELTAEQIEIGRQQYLAALQTFKNCKETGNFMEAYGNEIQPLQLPNWVR
jgi:exodeoxyribonuclease VIII